MHDDADEQGEPEAHEGDTFSATVRRWRGKRSRREVGEALVAALAELPEHERDPSVGPDHIRLWERGRAALPVPSTQKVLARVLGKTPYEVREAVGWEQIRRAGAINFVEQLLRTARGDGEPRLTMAEDQLLDALRAIRVLGLTTNLASAVEALTEPIEPPASVREVPGAEDISQIGTAFWWIVRLPPVVQSALWWRFLETSVLPATGLQEAGLPPDGIVAHLSTPAFFAHRAKQARDASSDDEARP